MAAGVALVVLPCYGETLPDESLSPDVRLLVDAGLDLDVAEAAAADGEGALLALMITMVTVHDIAIVVGVLPFPTASYVAEVTEFSVNLGLKALPPRFSAPESLSVDPLGGNGPGYTVDGCGIEFELLSAQAGYSNLLGIANIRDPFTQFDPFRIYPWRNFGDSDDPNAETRWVFLRAPKVYHANTGVGVEIQTSGQPGEPGSVSINVSLKNGWEKKTIDCSPHGLILVNVYLESRYGREPPLISLDTETAGLAEVTTRSLILH